MGNGTLAIQLKRASAVRYIWAFLGLPYRWGGDDPMAGFDCSGLVVEVLQGVGLLPHKSDYTAGGLYEKFKSNEVVRGCAGCLCLWFNTLGEFTHVEMMVDDYHTIGASGGGGGTTSGQAAIDQNAFIKMRPLGYRGTNYKLVDPFLAIT